MLSDEGAGVVEGLRRDDTWCVGRMTRCLQFDLAGVYGSMGLLFLCFDSS